MSKPDLNLLFALDALLAEGSVARAARRLRLSPSAMSRTLARLREATGDPLLVKVGRGLVPTPRALDLRDRIGPLVREAEAALGPAEDLDLRRLVRSFTIRTREGFVETFGLALVERVGREAPGVRLGFVQKSSRDTAPLEGTVDLETAVVGKGTGPELRTLALFRDRFVGVVRAGHPLGTGEVTPRRYADARHVCAFRPGPEAGSGGGPVDEALKALGLERNIAVTVGGFATALTLARNSDLVATVPERHTGALRDGMHGFALPVAVAEMTVSLLWHPRLDADPAHRWLRNCVREVCAERP